MRTKLICWYISILILCIILLATIGFSLCTGSVGISLKNILRVILEGKHTTEYSIIFDIRLPRIILGFAIGGALSIAGVILQGMFRNPLVEPYTLGISGGAALGVCLNIVLRFYQSCGIMTLPVSGFFGAIAVIILLYLLSIKKVIIKLQGLLLTGVMISFICSALIMLIMAISGVEDLQGIVFWIMGSLEESNWTLIKIQVLVSISSLAIAYFFWSHLNAFSLGEEAAHHLGIKTERTKRVLFVLSSIITGCCVSAAGIIGFVGLAIPHFIRIILGYDHRILIIGSYIAGASFLILCDTLSRTIIAPLELPVGVITGLLGGVIFVYANNRKSSRWL